MPDAARPQIRPIAPGGAGGLGPSRNIGDEMSNLSLSSVSDDTGAFFRREARLVMTVAFATFGLGLLLVELMTPDADAGGQVTPGNWMLWLVPAALLGIVGQLTLSLLVLTPGTSAKEAMGAGLRLLPTVSLVTDRKRTRLNSSH